MKGFSKKEYSYPELLVVDVEEKDVLSISDDAYNDDVFEPTGWGSKSI